MELSPYLFTGYKLLKYFLYPLSWIVGPVLLAFLIAIFPYSPRRMRWIRLLLLCSILLTALLATPIPGRTMLAMLEGWYPPFHPTATSKFDAIVVLAGGIYAQGSLRPQHDLSAYSRHRTTCGVDLYHQGLAPTLLLVGGDASLFDDGPVESLEMKRLAQRLGVEANAILTEERSRNTYENAVNAKRILGSSTILLVTSAYHLPRAVALFTKQGFTVTPAPCGYETKDRAGDHLARMNITDFLPSYSALATATHAIDEWAGILIYRIAGTL